LSPSALSSNHSAPGTPRWVVPASSSGGQSLFVGPAQVPGPRLLREPTTSIDGKRYSGFPSTNSPVKTPTYGAASTGGRFGLGVISDAHPVSPTIRSATVAIAVRAWELCSIWRLCGYMPALLMQIVDRSATNNTLSGSHDGPLLQSTTGSGEASLQVVRLDSLVPGRQGRRTEYAGRRTEGARLGQGRAKATSAGGIRT
jgi:hypothetical protein